MNVICNLEAEKAVLGAMIDNEEARAKGLAMLHKDDFYRANHRILFEALQKMDEKNIPIDYVSFNDYLKNREQLDIVGGISYVMELVHNSLPWHIDYHISLVIETSNLRRIKMLAEDAAGMEGDSKTIIDKLLSGIDEIQSARRKREAIQIMDAADEAMKIIELQAANPGKLLGLKTGFYELDKVTGGLQRSDLIIIAARTSVGKTSFLTTLLQGIGDNQKRGGAIIIFEYEIKNIQLAMKILLSEACVSMQKVRSGFISKEEMERIKDKQYTMRGAGNLFICDSSGWTVSQIRNECRRIKNKYGLQAIGVDYIQLVKPMAMAHEETRAQQVGSISKGLKELAIEFDIPVIALAQVNRAVEGRNIKIPTLADLKESGDLEQDADIVAFLYRPELYDPKDRPGEADLIIAKHRNGPTCTIKLKFISQYAKFEEMM